MSIVEVGFGFVSLKIQMFFPSKDIIPMSTIWKKVENGGSTLFWREYWLGDQLLSERFPRLFRLENDKNCLLNTRLVNEAWEWLWRRPVRGEGG